MSKPCELCLKVVNPPNHQMMFRMVCTPCARGVYKAMGGKASPGDVEYASKRKEDWFSFSFGSFCGQVDEMLVDICPQCRRKH